MGDVPQATLHYWGRTPSDLAYARRSAAVVFGRADGHASLVAVVDLLDQHGDPGGPGGAVVHDAT